MNTAPTCGALDKCIYDKRYRDSWSADNVIKFYNENVEQLFFLSLRLFEFDYTRERLDKVL